MQTMDTSKTITYGLMTAPEAAKRLGISKARVYTLIEQGTLELADDPYGFAGKTKLVTSRSVYRYRKSPRQKGRPLSPKMAYAMLWQLSGLETDWLTNRQQKRLEVRLEKATPIDVLAAVRKRAQVVLCKPSNGEGPKLQDLTECIASNESIERNFKLTTESDELYCYAKLSVIEESTFSRQGFERMRDGYGKTRVRIAEWFPSCKAAPPRALLAADLAEETEPRAKQAGMDMIERLLDEWKDGRSLK